MAIAPDGTVLDHAKVISRQSFPKNVVCPGMSLSLQLTRHYCKVANLNSDRHHRDTQSIIT